MVTVLRVYTLYFTTSEITRKFHHHFKGHHICCPMKLYSKEYIKEYLVKYQEDKTIREMAKYLGYSERWVKQLIQKSNSNFR